MTRRGRGPVPISAALERFFAELNPTSNGKGPAAEPPAPLRTRQRQLTHASDGSPTEYTFERFHEQTAHLTPEQRHQVFLALPFACRSQMWKRIASQSRAGK